MKWGLEYTPIFPFSKWRCVREFAGRYRLLAVLSDSFFDVHGAMNYAVSLRLPVRMRLNGIIGRLQRSSRVMN